MKLIRYVIPILLIFCIPMHSNAETLDSETLHQYCVEAEEEFGVSCYILEAIAERESRLETTAQNGSCVGLMQVSTKWHKTRAENLDISDWYDPQSNIRIAADYFSELLELTDNDISWALMRYNMKTSTANAMHDAGKISKYAKGVMDRAHQLELEAIDREQLELIYISKHTM